MSDQTQENRNTQEERLPSADNGNAEMFGIEPIFTEEERETDPRAVVTWLTELRHRRGLTQEHIAEFMDCSASRISRIESGDDRHLSISEAAAYVDALGMSCTLKVYDDEMPMDVQLRRTILEASRLLTRLHRLLKFRGNKEAILRIERFIGGEMMELFIKALDGDLPTRDAARGAMHAELAPGA